METIETALRLNFTSGEGMWSLSGSMGGPLALQCF
jgi:hypothetical protein